MHSGHTGPYYYDEPEQAGKQRQETGRARLQGEPESRAGGTPAARKNGLPAYQAMAAANGAAKNANGNAGQAKPAEVK